MGIFLIWRIGMHRNYVEAQVEVVAGNTTDLNRREQTEKWPRVLSHLTLNTKPLNPKPSHRCCAFIAGRRILTASTLDAQIVSCAARDCWTQIAETTSTPHRTLGLFEVLKIARVEEGWLNIILHELLEYLLAQYIKRARAPSFST